MATEYPKRENYNSPATYVDAIEQWELEQDPRPDPWRTIDSETGEFRDATAEETHAMRMHNALYVVDLRRWEFSETPNEDFDADDINSEWKRINADGS
jgi:hypothetical protein